MTTKLKWRLGKLPTPEEVTLLLSQGVLTKDEAREILFSLETDEDRDKQSLQEEIKFLRQLVQSLSTRSSIVEHIYKYEKPYTQQPWWHNYQAYCSAPSGNSITATGGLTSVNGNFTANLASGTTANALYTSTSAGGSAAIYSYSEPSFTNISTF